VFSASTWVAVVGGIGQLFLAAFGFSHGPRNRFAFLLGCLCADFAGWTLAAAAYAETGGLAWHLLDLSLSPLVPPLGLALVAAFTGDLERHRRGLALAFAPFLLLAASSAGAAVSPGLARWVESPGWSTTYIALFVPAVAGSVGMLVRHRRRTAHREGRRTRGLLWGLASAALLGLTELFADLGAPVPRLGHVASLSTALILVWLGAREHLFGRTRRHWGLPLGFAGACLFAMAQLVLAEETGRLGPVIGLGLTAVVFSAAGVALARALTRDERQRRERLVFTGRMGAQLAHDLRTPLAALRGALDVIQVAMERGETPDPAMVDLAADQERRITAVTDRYSRLARMEPVPTPTALGALLRRVGAAVGGVAVDGVDLGDLRVDLDEALFVPALQNLLKNALEAGGEATVQLDARRHGPSVVIRIRDEGRGMDPRHRSLAERGFFTTKPEGSGLGLAFAREVVELHGGTLHLESTEDLGTTVVVELPSPSNAA